MRERERERERERTITKALDGEKVCERERYARRPPITLTPISMMNNGRLELPILDPAKLPILIFSSAGVSTGGGTRTT